MRFDKRGNPVSYNSQPAIQGLDQAIEKLAAYQADPVADADAVLAEHPDFVMAHAFRAGALATATDRAFEAEARKSLAAAEALSASANDRERHHIAACRAWLDGDWETGVEAWGRASMGNPRDLFALQMAHLGDFFLGWSHMLRDRVARVLPAWQADCAGYGFVEGMYAFGLEECGAYSEAEERGRHAITLNPQDGWAVHAVTHVMEMQGRTKEGANFLESSAAQWSPNSMFSYHLWWHKALFHLDAKDNDAALDLFDHKISTGGFGQALELVDGSALLWRLQLVGCDVGNRWELLSEKWETRIDHALYAFNDVSAMMAFVGAGNTDAQARLLKGMRRSIDRKDTNAMMCREVGLPAAEGLMAFGRGDYAKAIGLLLPVRGKANRFGGSHAQRDMFSWTLTEAAVRLGDAALATAFIAERQSWKPESPLNRFWSGRAAGAR